MEKALQHDEIHIVVIVVVVMMMMIVIIIIVSTHTSTYHLVYKFGMWGMSLYCSSV